MTIDQIIVMLAFGVFGFILIVFVCSRKDDENEQRKIYTQQIVPIITIVEEFTQPSTEYDSFLGLPPI